MNVRKLASATDTFRPFRLGVLPIPGFALMSYACTVEPLRAANLLSGRKLYDVVHLGAAPLVASSGSVRIADVGTATGQTDLDLLLVVAGGDPFAFNDEQTFAWLRQLAGQGISVGGVSGGSVILARAGLLGGSRMTVHWEHAGELARQYPDMLIEKRLYVIDRDRVTCGGGIAPLDLMHAMIADHHGSDFARLVSDWFLHTDIRAAAAPQRAGPAGSEDGHPRHIAEAISAMESHIADPLSLPQLALVTGITARQLNRLFSDAFGESVMSYYRMLRLSVGRRLLSGSPMSMAEIADATGFSNAGHFSDAFKDRFGLRPSQARLGVSGRTAFSGD